MHCYQRQKEFVREAQGDRRRVELPRTNRFLGRPSVGGRLTGSGARNENREPASSAHIGSAELRLECGPVPGCLAVRQSGRVNSLVARRKNSMLSAARGPAEYRSAEVGAAVLAPASTPAQSSA